MLSETVKRLPEVDSPWHRLPWTASIALLIWAAALWGLGNFMERPGPRQAAPPPLDARLIEEPAPAPAQPVQPARAAVAPKPKPLVRIRREQAPAAPQISAPVEQAPAAPKAESPTNTGVSVLTAAPGSAATPGEGQVPTGGSTQASNSANGSTQAGAYDGRGSSTGPYDGKGSSRVGAAYLDNPRPIYPPSARKMGMEGLVMLKVLVGRGGNVLELEVAKSSGFELLDKAAKEAVKKWRFVSARRGDSAVDEWVQVPVAFRLSR